MLKTIIRKLGKKKKNPKACKDSMFCFVFVFFFSSFKLKRLIQNPKAKLKRLWVGLDSGTK